MTLSSQRHQPRDLVYFFLPPSSRLYVSPTRTHLKTTLPRAPIVALTVPLPVAQKDGHLQDFATDLQDGTATEQQRARALLTKEEAAQVEIQKLKAKPLIAQRAGATSAAAAAAPSAKSVTVIGMERDRCE